MHFLRLNDIANSHCLESTSKNYGVEHALSLYNVHPNSEPWQIFHRFYNRKSVHDKVKPNPFEATQHVGEVSRKRSW